MFPGAGPCDSGHWPAAPVRVVPVTLPFAAELRREWRGRSFRDFPALRFNAARFCQEPAPQFNLPGHKWFIERKVSAIFIARCVRGGRNVIAIKVAGWHRAAPVPAARGPAVSRCQVAARPGKIRPYAPADQVTHLDQVRRRESVAAVKSTSARTATTPQSAACGRRPRFSRTGGSSPPAACGLCPRLPPGVPGGVAAALLADPGVVRVLVTEDPLRAFAAVSVGFHVPILTPA